CPEKCSAVAPQAWQPQLQRSALGGGFPGGHQLAFLGVPAPFSHLTVRARTNVSAPYTPSTNHPPSSGCCAAHFPLEPAIHDASRRQGPEGLPLSQARRL